MAARADFLPRATQHASEGHEPDCARFAIVMQAAAGLEDLLAAHVAIANHHDGQRDLHWTLPQGARQVELVVRGARASNSAEADDAHGVQPGRDDLQEPCRREVGEHADERPPHLFPLSTRCFERIGFCAHRLAREARLDELDLISIQPEPRPSASPSTTGLITTDGGRHGGRERFGVALQAALLDQLRRHGLQSSASSASERGLDGVREIPAEEVSLLRRALPVPLHALRASAPTRPVRTAITVTVSVAIP